MPLLTHWQDGAVSPRAVAIRLLETLLIRESLLAKAVHFDELEDSWKTNLPHLRSGVRGGRRIYGPMPQVRHDRRAGF